MNTIPLHLQRRFEQRWAARFVRPVASATPKINVAYWLVNGAQQAEDFNGFKSQALIVTLKPTSTLTWNVNTLFMRDLRQSARAI